MIYTDGIHLIASEGIVELHAFAKDIGLNKCWFHFSRHPHYDLFSGKKPDNREKALKAALQNGAIETDSRTLVKISRGTYFLPETEKEVEAFEKKYKWELNKPPTQKDVDTAANLKAKLFNELFGEQCGGAKCTIKNCPVCKNEQY